MFTDLLFLILGMLAIAFSTPSRAADGGVYALALYAVLLLLLRIRLLRKKLLVPLFLITYLVIAYPLLDIGSYYWMGSYALLSLGGLLLYFFGLWWGLRKEAHLGLLLPFCFPYLALDLIFDVEPYLGLSAVWSELIPIGAFVLVAAFFPYVLQRVWRCRPLAYPELEALCRRCRFRHGGLKTWPAMKGSTTAAIVGLIYPFRYVLFTPKLLGQLSTLQVEAVLAHEIGHSKCYHLWSYLLILVGMPLLMILWGIYLEQWLPSHPIILYIPYALIAALYFRFVFGFFSRLFEQQADFYTLKLELEQGALASALDEIAARSGHIHNKPSWHHGSIARRIKQLELAEENPTLIKRHDRLIKKVLSLYGCLLGTTVLLLVLGVL